MARTGPLANCKMHEQEEWIFEGLAGIWRVFWAVEVAQSGFDSNQEMGNVLAQSHAAVLLKEHEDV